MARTAVSKEVDELLRPVFRSFKRQAAEAIRGTQEEMKNVLRVSYDAPAEARPDDLPCPRLQLRWTEEGPNAHNRVCHYELVFPLHEHDVRNEPKTGYAVVELGRTNQGGSPVDWDNGDLTHRTPYRDGVHANWDSAVFGWMPVFIIAPNGRSARVTLDAEKRATTEKQVAPLLAKRAL